jgi:hypothetical protein
LQKPPPHTPAVIHGAYRAHLRGYFLLGQWALRVKFWTEKIKFGPTAGGGGV